MTEQYNTSRFKSNIRTLVIWPDDRLSTKCSPVTEFDDDLKQLVVDMIATLRENQGVGLAAPQVGVSSNLLVIQFEEKREPMVLINPEIIEIDDSKQFEIEEGCLSVPGYFKQRKRPHRIIVKFHDVGEKEHEVEFRGFFAFVIQHEMDHLEGKTFVDGLSKLKQIFIKKKIKNTIRNT